MTVDDLQRAATYVDHMLKGAKPTVLPVQAPVKFKLVINVRMVKALGLTVPPTLLVLCGFCCKCSGRLMALPCRAG